jgi:hypothetical protein
MGCRPCAVSYAASMNFWRKMTSYTLDKCLDSGLCESAGAVQENMALKRIWSTLDSSIEFYYRPGEFPCDSSMNYCVQRPSHNLSRRMAFRPNESSYAYLVEPTCKTSLYILYICRAFPVPLHEFSCAAST